ncbi:MAG TPA: prepilin-type N-terminal cleavage/methylation domain-containing protein [Thermoanaerobaculia bacterium]|nr:prepilin-type N-terminal cleavage/methylation domain-containing protein [Thermoanaerobaculia bacterium]
MSRHARGYSLIELLISLSALALIFLVAMPAFGSMRRRSALRTATANLRTIFHVNRSRAIATGQSCGMKFTRLAGEWHFAVYEDGDGDGVRNDDIKSGKDPMLEPPRVVFPEGARIVTIGLLPETIKDPDGDPLPPTKSAVAFGNSQICSFSALGESTPGTIYLTDRRRELFAVRVYGATAKIRVVRYERKTKKWVAW